MSRKRKGSHGAPHKFTEDVERNILNALAAGATIGDACTLAGISERTFYNWKKEAEKPGTKHRNLRAFFQKVDTGRLDLKMRSLALLRRAIVGGDVPTAKWYLERRYADEYGSRSNVQMDAEVKTAAITIADLRAARARAERELPDEEEGEEE